MKKWAPFKLTRADVEALEEALFDTLPAHARVFLEAWLSSYKNRQIITPKQRARWAREDRELINAGDRFLHLMRMSSPEDFSEGLERPSKRSALHEAIAARIEQWKSRAAQRLTWSRPWSEDSELVPWDTPRHRPGDGARLHMLDRVCSVLDDSGLEIQRSWHKTGPRVRMLRVVLQIADRIDGKPAGRGSMRLITKLKSEREKTGRFSTDTSKGTKVSRQPRISVT